LAKMITRKTNDDFEFFLLIGLRLSRGERLQIGFTGSLARYSRR
jgi:hypothetical protein